MSKVISLLKSKSIRFRMSKLRLTLFSGKIKTLQRLLRLDSCRHGTAQLMLTALKICEAIMSIIYLAFKPYT